MSQSVKDVLEIRNLVCRARTLWEDAVLIDIPELSVREGEIFGLVGESGAGKSILAQTIMRILPENVSARSGEILFNGRDLMRIHEREMVRDYRGKRLAMIFQDPMASLNPVFTIQEQMEAVIHEHNDGFSKNDVTEKAVSMLELVKLSDPRFTIRKYPHELSGGMRQRVLIAIALSSGAKFLISDEATRALDVTIQAGILKLLERLREELGLSTLFISSNIALAASVCERIGILFDGTVVETGAVSDVLKRPSHFYTRMFLSCLPTPDKKGKPMPVYQVGGGRRGDDGCRFAPFCHEADEACRTHKPLLQPVGRENTGHCVACFKGGGSGAS